MAQAPSYGARGLKRTIALPEAPSQSFKIGDFLTLNANGQLIQTLSTGTNLGASNNPALPQGRVVGRAMQNASGVTGKLVDVMIAEPGTEFLIPVYHGTPTSAVPDTALIGKEFEIRYVAGSGTLPNWFGLDISATTNAKAKVSDMYIPDHTGWDPTVPGFPTHNSTTQYGQVWVEFMSPDTIYGGAH